MNNIHVLIYRCLEYYYTWYAGGSWEQQVGWVGSLVGIVWSIIDFIYFSSNINLGSFNIPSVFTRLLFIQNMGPCMLKCIHSWPLLCYIIQSKFCDRYTSWFNYLIGIFCNFSNYRKQNIYSSTSIIGSAATIVLRRVLFVIVLLLCPPNRIFTTSKIWT